MIDLPAEVWGEIFALAADEDVLFQYISPTVMAEYAWYEDLVPDGQGDSDEDGDFVWALRSPQEALNLIQRRSYATKKAIILTCKLFHKLGSELFFRCLFFKNPTRLQSICQILDASSVKATTLTSSIGWWTRRIHLSSPEKMGVRTASLSPITRVENALVSVIHHCPNLEIFLAEWPMGSSFGPIADALTTFARKSLQTIHWCIPCEALPRVIWALNYLPHLVSVTLDFYEPASDLDEITNLGAAGDLQLDLPNLQQLSLKGYFQEFLEQASGWNLPSLRSFSFHSVIRQMDQPQPDLIAFLTQHGLQLRFLDLNSHQSLDVPKILDLCPVLLTFAFNADWIIRPVASNQPNQISLPSMTPLVNNPHHHIRVIGLHGLTHAFGVSSSIRTQSRDPIASFVACSWNDMNFTACNKTNFPKLQRIRVLNSEVLEDLNRENGPTKEDGGFDRWEKWWNLCQRMNVRLEDCTGDVLGTLPEAEDDELSDDDEYDDDEDSEEGESEYETGEEDYDDDDEDGEPRSVKKKKKGLPGWKYTAFSNSREQSPHVSELRQLLEECRAMAQERDESMIQGIGALQLN